MTDFVEIPLPDGRKARLPKGMSRQEMAEALNKLTGSQPQREPPGFLDRTGQAVSDAAKAGGSGFVRGVTSLMDLPSTIGNLAQGAVERGYEYATGNELPDDFKAGMNAPILPLGIDPRNPYAGNAANAVAPSVMGYNPQTTAGEYAQTVGEFAGGASLGGPNAMLRYGVLPGLASETAGQATEGTAVEPYARAAAALGTSIAATPKPTSVGPRMSRAQPDRAASAGRLQAEGIRPTAGQVADNSTIMRAEGTLAPREVQLDQFTRAALRSAGNSSASRATPQALSETQSKITQGMNAILDLDAPIDASVGQRALQVTDDYFTGTAGGQLPVALRRVADEFVDLATKPGTATVPTATMRKWRSVLGKYTTSSEEMTRDAAHALREVIDDLTENVLTQAGRADDIARLAELRTQYRNFLTIADATTRGGREGASGILTPERVSTAAKRIFGRQNYATGRGTDLSELSRDALMTIGSAPTVTPGGIRDVATATSLATAGGLAGWTSGPVGAVAGALAGAAAPTVGSAVMRSGPVQAAMMNTQDLARSGYVLPGLLSSLAD